MEKITIIELSNAAKAENIAPEQIESLQSSFMPFFQQASEWKGKAMAIQVTSIEQKEAMKDARTARLALKGIRVDTEKRRKEMKEESLRKGKAIDGMANVIFYLIEPIEKHLQEQEDFAARLEAKEREETRQLREAEAGPYMAFFPQTIDLATVTDNDFARLLNGAKLQKQAADAERKRQEDEATEKVRIESEAREAMRVENELLRQEAAEQAEITRKEREAVQKEWRNAQAVLGAEREAAQKARREIQAALYAEREKAQAIEAAQRREKEEVERKAREAAQAPDRDKLRAYAAKVRAIEMPEITGEPVRQLRAGLKMIHDGLEMIER